MQALAAGTTALAAKNAYDAVQTAQALEPTGNSVKDAANQVGGVNLSISIGSSKSSSTSTQTSSTAQGSNVLAGGDINIKATGAGADSDINMIGSQIRAGNNVALVADDQINLIAAKNTDTLASKNKSSSASVGVSIGTSGLAVTASASKGKGKANGTDVTWTETTVEAGNKVALESGTDTNLIGAQVRGEQVVADVGTSGSGNLNIQSLQDTSTYDSKQKSAGISVSVPIGAGSYGGSVSVSNSKINSDYASVNEQAGVYAGDEGFQVNVNGNTNLTGAVIASTEQAIQNNKNRLTTETLTVSNIQNHAEYEADSSSMGLSMSYNPSESVTKNVGSNLVNLPGTLTPDLNQEGSESSVTHSAVSAAQIAITDDAKQTALTGKNADTTVATLNRDTANANNGILTKPDVTAIQNEMAANASITSAATQQVTTAINAYYVRRMAEYDQQYNDKLNLARDKEAEAAFLTASGRTSEADILIAEAQTLRYQAVDIRNERDNPSLSQGLAITLGNVLVGGLAGEVNIANAATSYAVGTLGNTFLLTAQKRDSDITQGFIATCKKAPPECAQAASGLDNTINNTELPLEERIKALTELKSTTDNTLLFEIKAVDSNSQGLFNIAVNGIQNEPDRALVLGIGHLRDGEAIEQSIYLSYNDTQGSLADLLNAAIDKYAQATSNPSGAIVQALIASHGNQQTNLIAHSGGTLSSNITLNDYAAQGHANPNLYIDYFGPASSTGAAVAAALNAAGLAGATPEQQANWLAYGNIEGIKGSGGLGYYNHANDPVATVVGGNLGQTNQYNDPDSPTHLQGIALGNLLQSILELKALFTTSNSAHSTYRWNDPSTWPTTTVTPTSAR